MKLVIAGTRDFADSLGMFVDSGAEVVENALARDALPSPGEIDTVLSGEAKGPDQWGEAFADAHGIDVERYPPQWDKHEDDRKPAPYYRNRAMAVQGDALLAFWDGKSGGTRHMIDKSQEEGITKHVVRMDDKSTRYAMLKGDDVRAKINTYVPDTPNQDLTEIAKTVSD